MVIKCKSYTPAVYNPTEITPEQYTIVGKYHQQKTILGKNTSNIQPREITPIVYNFREITPAGYNPREITPVENNPIEITKVQKKT